MNAFYINANNFVCITVGNNDSILTTEYVFVPMEEHAIV